MAHEEPPPPLILLVEDETLLRLHAANVLEEAGYQVVEAGDAEAALKILETRTDVRLLFTDVQIPGECDGLALAQRVHQRWPHVLLLVTSSSSGLDDASVPSRGRFMPKPYDGETVIDRVADLIQKDGGVPRG